MVNAVLAASVLTLAAPPGGDVLSTDQAFGAARAMGPRSALPPGAYMRREADYPAGLPQVAWTPWGSAAVSDKASIQFAPAPAPPQGQAVSLGPRQGGPVSISAAANATPAAGPAAPTPAPLPADARADSRDSSLPLGVQLDGLLKVEATTASSSETGRILAAEENLACLRNMSVAACMEKFGSYGIRRLYTEAYSDIIDLGWERPEWMAHGQVQRRRVFDLTLPMTHASASSAVEGDESGASMGRFAVTNAQSLTVYQQLRLGVRALDIGVCLVNVPGAAEPELWAAHGLPNVPLRKVLLDIKRFLGRYRQEVVLLFAHKADLWGRAGSIAPLQAEEAAPDRVPGETVHQVIQSVLGDFLADYTKLASGLPPGIDALENPTVQDLGTAKARLLYFWEGQQVLCTSRATCSTTPGWGQQLGQPLAFGPPMAIGTRRVGADPMMRVLEPTCLSPSFMQTNSSDPFAVVRNLEAYVADPLRGFRARRPICFPVNSSVVSRHVPPLLHEADAYIMQTRDTQAQLQQMLQNSSQSFTDGEAFTARTAAERLNFLLLSLLLRKGEEAAFLKPNLWALDFIHPIHVHRLVEAMQLQPDCGFALNCKETGSCFAMSLLGSDGTCVDQRSAESQMQAHADGGRLTLAQKCTIALAVWFCVKLVAFLVYKTVSPYYALPRPVKTHEYWGFLWHRIPEPEQPAAEDFPAEVLAHKKLHKGQEPLLSQNVAEELADGDPFPVAEADAAQHHAEPASEHAAHGAPEHSAHPAPEQAAHTAPAPPEHAAPEQAAHVVLEHATLPAGLPAPPTENAAHVAPAHAPAAADPFDEA